MNNCMQLEVIQYTKGHGARGTKEGRPIKWIQLWAKSTWSEWQIEFNCLATWQKCSIFRFGQGCPLFARFVLFFFFEFLDFFLPQIGVCPTLDTLDNDSAFAWLLFAQTFPPSAPWAQKRSTQHWKCLPFRPALTETLKKTKKGVEWWPWQAGSELAVINNTGVKKRTDDNLKYEIIYNY